MMKHYWTVVVRKSHIDQETNNLILGEVVEQIQCGLPDEIYSKFEKEVAKQGFALIPAEYEVISYLDSESPDSTEKISIELELPNGKNVQLVDVLIKFGANGRTRHRFRSNGLQVSGSGRNLFKIYDATGKQKKLLAEIPLFVDVNVVASGFIR